jgi:hypothetical protein
MGLEVAIRHSGIGIDLAFAIRVSALVWSLSANSWRGSAKDGACSMEAAKSLTPCPPWPRRVQSETDEAARW